MLCVFDLWSICKIKTFARDKRFQKAKKDFARSINQQGGQQRWQRKNQKQMQ